MKKPNLASMDVNDYPEILVPETDEGLAVIDKARLASLLPATLKEAGRAQLDGVYFDAKNSRACATDGHRLHMVPAVTEKSFILPRIAAAVMMATEEEDELQVRVSADGEYVVLNAGKAVIISRTVEGEFPDVSVVIPKNTKHTVTMRKVDVTKAMKQALLMCSDKYAGASLSFNGGIDIEVTNPEKGEYQRSNIPLASGHVDPVVDLKFNLHYIQDIMNHVGNDDEIVVGLTDEKSPLTFAHGEFEAVVMPMRT